MERRLERVLGNTLYVHIVIHVGLASYPGRSRDVPGDFMILTLNISSSLECRLYLSSLENSTLPLLSGYELISFIIHGKHHLLSAAHFSLSHINIHLHCNEW